MKPSPVSWLTMPPWVSSTMHTMMRKKGVQKFHREFGRLLRAAGGVIPDVAEHDREDLFRAAKTRIAGENAFGGLAAT
ncbi:MAG: hypothetical protein WDO13_07765 [Verrucomicrobiota bacterium]